MIIDEIREKIKFQKNILIVGNDSGKLKEIYNKVLKMIKEEKKDYSHGEFLNNNLERKEKFINFFNKNTENCYLTLLKLKEELPCEYKELKKEIKTRDLIEFLDKYIKLETGLFKEQKELIKETYYFFRDEVENDKDRLWRNADYYTKHMNSYYKTKNFLERNYKPITKYLIELAKNEYDLENNIKNDNLNSVKKIEIK